METAQIVLYMFYPHVFRNTPKSGYCDIVHLNVSAHMEPHEMNVSVETFHEYAFDVKLYAVVRVRAKSESEGREAVLSFLDAADITSVAESHAVRPHVAEANVYVDDETGPYLIEIDGEEVD